MIVRNLKEVTRIIFLFKLADVSGNRSAEDTSWLVIGRFVSFFQGPLVVVIIHYNSRVEGTVNTFKGTEIYIDPRYIDRHTESCLETRFVCAAFAVKKKIRVLRDCAITKRDALQFDKNCFHYSIMSLFPLFYYVIVMECAYA